MEREIARALYYNPDADTLDIWLGDPSSEAYAEPLTENLVSKRNRRGEVVGLDSHPRQAQQRRPEEDARGSQSLAEGERGKAIHHWSPAQVGENVCAQVKDSLN
ncbi:MAG: hypothetical protein JRN39_01225 [Nitrososphaerota archaeon]|nr:hypothetical protein [Nitrososphaerota archaeon]